MSDYVFYLTDESFDYPTGYGTDTEIQFQPHGFELDGLDMSTFNAYGYYDLMNDTVKTLEDLGNYIKEHYKEIKYIDECKRRCYTSTMYENENLSNWENFDKLLEAIGKELENGKKTTAS